MHKDNELKCDCAGSVSDRVFGEKLIADGKMGCLILAGGQGTRLGSEQPKGTIPVSVIKNKSLFQIFFEKTRAASKRAGQPLLLAIMTSPLNHEATLRYLRDNKWFGLSESQVFFFSQKMLPVLDEAGNPLYDAEGKMAEGPAGNGSALKDFYEAGIWDKWRKLGIDYLSVIPIDNPLADPFDCELCGYHARMENEITIKAVPRRFEEEKVGLILEKEGRIKVIEYSELSAEEKKGKRAANAGLFCFNMDFIPKIQHVVLPQHKSFKMAPSLSRMVWKTETFIFDLLEYGGKIGVILYPREKAFAPLKESSGEFGLEGVQEALLASDRLTYFEISGIMPSKKKFELDQTFYYPTPELLKRWKGKPFPDQDYIQSSLL